MVQRALIETSICIDYLRGVQAAIYYLDEMRDRGWLRCSVVTCADGRLSQPQGRASSFTFYCGFCGRTYHSGRFA